MDFAKPPSEKFDVTARYLDATYQSADGLRLHYRDYATVPDLPAVLCMPGLTRNCRDFEPIAQHMAPRFRVLSPDLRGRGESEYDPVRQHYQPLTYVADMWRLLDHLHLTRCILLGTSLGGVMGMIMAAAQPGRIAGLVLNDIGPEVGAKGIARIVEYVGHQPPAPDWRSAADQAREIHGANLPGLSRDRWLAFAHATCRNTAQGIVPDMDPEIGTALREAGKASTNLWSVFACIRTPTLVLRGALSDILLPETVEAMQQRHPDLRAATIPHRGHAPLLDEAPSMAAIDRFLHEIH